MPYQGDGTFARPVGDYVFDTVISESDVNAEMDGIATGFGNTVARDGQSPATANLPMDGFRHTEVGAGSARTDYAQLGQTQDGKVNWVDGGGTADAITAAYSPALTALVDGQECHVRATAANATTTPTFSPNGLTARTIVKSGGSALVAGDIAGDGHELDLRYDLANTRWELLNPAQSNAGLAVLASANVFTENQTIQSDDAGATVDPTLTLDRNSASPADSDVLGAVVFNGRDDGGNATAYAQIQGEAVDVTDTEEDGRLALQTMVAGTKATRVTVGQGVVVGTATGGDQGAGTVNATAIYDDGVQLVAGWRHTDSAASTSGTSIDFTDIPSGVTEIVVTFVNIEQGTANQQLMVQIGDSGGLATSGYVGHVTGLSGAPVSDDMSSGFFMTEDTLFDATFDFSGRAVLRNVSGNIWQMDGVGGVLGGASFVSAGTKTLSGVLDRLSVITQSGATFSQGTIYVNAR